MTRLSKLILILKQIYLKLGSQINTQINNE